MLQARINKCSGRAFIFMRIDKLMAIVHASVVQYSNTYPPGDSAQRELWEFRRMFCLIHLI